MKIRLAARGSALSLAQVEWAARAITSSSSTASPALSVETEIATYRTTGDRLSQTGAPLVGKGVFTREIDEAVLEGRADIGVHSLKDLPSELAPGMVLAAVPTREDPSDVLLSRPRVRFAELPSGARVGTGSPRRRAQLLAIRPDLSVSDARGNVDTRIRRLEEGRWDAIVLARAGLARLGRLEEVCDVFEEDVMLPAIGQGALAFIIREGDAQAARALAALDDPAAHREVLAERRLLKRLHAGCQAPLAGRARVSGGILRLSAGVFSVDGAESVREEAEGPVDDAIGVADRVADALLARGAERILQEARV